MTHAKNMDTLDMDPLNTSDHTLIILKLDITLQRNKTATKRRKIVCRPKWDKCNKSTYKKEVSKSLCNINKILSPKEKLNELNNALHSAGKEAMPRYRSIQTIKPVGKVSGTGKLVKPRQNQNVSVNNISYQDENPHLSKRNSEKRRNY